MGCVGRGGKFREDQALFKRPHDSRERGAVCLRRMTLVETREVPSRKGSLQHVECRFESEGRQGRAGQGRTGDETQVCDVRDGVGWSGMESVMKERRRGCGGDEGMDEMMRREVERES